LECKEAEVNYSVSIKEKGKYEVSYTADFKEDKQLSLAVMHFGNHIKGSPFSVTAVVPEYLLLEFSSSAKHNRNWLDDAVQRMSNIPRARLRVILHDAGGRQVYEAIGETSCRWTQKNITAPIQKSGRQWRESKHTNVIHLDNNDAMMIIGKSGGCDKFNWNADGYDQFRSYNIVINKGWSPNAGWGYPRRMIIALSAPSVHGWTAPGNLISFSSSGFVTGSQGWPKFTGIFRIYFKPL